MDLQTTLKELVLEELEPEPVPLEPTCFAPTAMPPPALLPELESNSVDDLAAALATALPTGAGEAREPWIEPTCQMAVEVEVESLDVERFAPVANEPAAARGACACRYCGAPAGSEQAFCEQCGMHRERSGASAPALPEAVSVRCRSCGSLGSGARCRACGDRLAEMPQ